MSASWVKAAAHLGINIYCMLSHRRLIRCLPVNQTSFAVVLMTGVLKLMLLQAVPGVQHF